MATRVDRSSARSGRRPWRLTLRRKRRLNLALQGGGAHGAFTWGVLARLLAEERLHVAGISGASAGALNAVVLASGWLAGGREGAAQALAELWREVARLAGPSALRAGGLTHMAADLAAQFLSPYQLNPWDVNPLRAVLERLVDFERLRAERALRLVIAATNVRTGQPRMFTNAELDTNVVLASACLPQISQAVEIGGEFYWDGGFSANPPVVPLVEIGRARDVVLVQINPLAAEGLPQTPRAIRNRIAEIVFGRPLAEELERLGQSAKEVGPLGWLSPRRRRLARHRLHRIDGSAMLATLDPTTKIDPKWSLLQKLRDQGWRAADAWLAPKRRRRSTDTMARSTVDSGTRRRAS